jgi:hypothetical protein
VAGCCECGDEPSGYCATELVSYKLTVLDLGILLHCEYSFHLPEKPISLCSPLKHEARLNEVVFGHLDIFTKAF